CRTRWRRKTSCWAIAEAAVAPTPFRPKRAPTVPPTWIGAWSSAWFLPCVHVSRASRKSRRTDTRAASLIREAVWSCGRKTRMPDPAAPTKHMDLSATSRAGRDSADSGGHVAGRPWRCDRRETEVAADRIDERLALAAETWPTIVGGVIYSLPS